MDLIDDVVALVLPMPAPPNPDDPTDPGHDPTVFSEMCEQVAEDRRETAQQMQLSLEEGDVDPLLAELAAARRRREQIDALIRRLIAYGREFVRPRPYPLTELARAAGMSPSGVRITYDHPDVEAVTAATGRKPRQWRAPAEPDDTTNEDLAELDAQHADQMAEAAELADDNSQIAGGAR